MFRDFVAQHDAKRKTQARRSARFYYHILAYAIEPSGLLQFRLLAGEAHEDFFVLGERVFHDICRDFRTRVGLAPVESFEPVTDVLLVETFLVLANLVLVCRPVAAGVRSEHFVDEDGFAIDFTEFELGVGKDPKFSSVGLRRKIFTTTLPTI